MRSSPQRKRREFFVVGGGPAGMEAARVAALRGHDVTLYEKEPKLHGLVNLASMIKEVNDENLPALISYLQRQVEKRVLKSFPGAKSTSLSLKGSSRMW